MLIGCYKLISVFGMIFGLTKPGQALLGKETVILPVLRKLRTHPMFEIKNTRPKSTGATVGNTSAKGVEWIEVFSIRGGDSSYFSGNPCNHCTGKSGRLQPWFCCSCPKP